jgi:hypothetical protein
MIDEINKNQSLKHLNIDVFTIILSFLSRKNKFILSILNKDFFSIIVPSSMVSVRFLKN